MKYMGSKNRLAKDIAPILHKGIYIITGGLMILLQIVLLPLFFINIFIAILIYFSVWLIFIGLIILINDV